MKTLLPPLLALVAACDTSSGDSSGSPVGAECGNSSECVEGASCVSGECAGRGRVAGRVFLNGTVLDGDLHVAVFPLDTVSATALAPADAAVTVTFAEAQDPQEFSVANAPVGERVLVAYSIFPAAPPEARVGFGATVVEVIGPNEFLVDGQLVESVDLYLSGTIALEE